MEQNLLQEPEDDYPRREVIIIFAVFFEGGLAPISLVIGWLVGHSPLETFEWNVAAVLWGIVATIPLTLMSLAMLRWPIGPFRWFKEFCDKDVVSLLGGSSLSEIALISLSSSVGEEMLFRGVLQAALSGWLGTPWGLGIASMLFGLVHPISVQLMAMEAFLGLYLGGVWIVGGNLLMVMVAHGLYKFTTLSYLIRIRPPGGVSSA